MRTTLSIAVALALSLTGLHADPVVYALPDGSTYTADLDVKFTPKAFALFTVPGKSRQFWLHLVAKGGPRGLGLDVLRAEGDKHRSHHFDGVIGGAGPLVIDRSQLPGAGDPEPAGVAMGITIALPILPPGEPHAAQTWQCNERIPVPPNKFVTVQEVEVVTKYTLKTINADRLTASVTAVGSGKGPGGDCVNMDYAGDIAIERASGMPLSAKLEGHFAKSGVASALCRVTFTIALNGTRVVHGTGPAASLLGVNTQGD